MTQDPNKKTLRSFQCRDYLWEIFEQMSQELECSVDYLVNEAMRQYARSRNYGVRSPSSPGMQRPPSGPPSAPASGIPSLGGSANPPAQGPQQGAGRPQIPSAPPPPPQRQPPQAPPPPQQGQGQGYYGQGQQPPQQPQGGYPPQRPAYPTQGGYGQQGGYPPAPPGAQPPPSSYPPPPPTQRPAPPPYGGGQPQQPQQPPIQQGPPPQPQGQGQAASAPPPLPNQQPQGGQPAAAAGQASPLFVIFNGQKIPVSKGEFVIGRGSKTADLPIKDGNISRRHAAVVYQDGTYYLKDLGSTNGVEFAGRRVDAKRIDEGDVFQICDYELRFTYR